MSAEKFVAYYRVSTARQGESGLGLDAQKKAVLDYLNGGNWSLIESFVEIESGKRNDRPELHRALSLCRAIGARLVIARLDRLARNASFMLSLKDSGIDFVAADQPHANRLVVGILALVAEAEAHAVSIRTKAALAAAKRRGVVLGTPANLGNRSQGTARSAEVRADKAQARAADLKPMIDDIKASGVTSASGIACALNQRGISAARGGLWSAVQVQRLLNLADRPFV